MKTIFIIDWILIPLFLLSAFSGIELHVAGHGNDHEIWHNWAVFHITASLLFLIAAIFHMIKHRTWYKGVATRRKTIRKNKTTLGLSVAFVLLSLTGIILLYTEGAGSDTGLWHYRIGIVVSVLSAGHIFKRIPILRKSLAPAARP